MATHNYIVRQPIKNTKSQVIGHEILYYGENELYGGLSTSAARMVPSMSSPLPTLSTISSLKIPKKP